MSKYIELQEISFKTVQSFWGRTPNPPCLGIVYIRFSAICASAVRAALKPQFKVEAMKVAESSVKVYVPKAIACEY
uniref:Uncharacterized protein n=1 Tax=Hucho hucho TaxID=62062 RepID=A0A4W5QGG3_9TELE